MRVSVIIPTYKPGDYIWDCMRSLKAQTLDREKFEVLVILNGCCEPYCQRIRYFISDNLEDMNITLVQLDEGGVSNARNKGIELSKGENIAFIDDDDYVSPTYLEELLSIISPDTVALSNTKAFNDGHAYNTIPFRLSSAYESCIRSSDRSVLKAKKFFSGPCMKLLPKEVIGQRRFNPNFKNGEDSIFMFQISDKIKGVAFTSEKAVYYRRFRVGSAVTSKRTFRQKLGNAFRMIREYMRIYFSSPTGYDFMFFATRILGALKGALIK